MIKPINPLDEGIAERIVEIQMSAYAVEAALMGFDGIPQLSETADSVRSRTDLTWMGAFDGNRLAGIIAWLIEDGLTDIDRLAVDPNFARRGYGRRLVQAVPTDRETIVSTGTKNDPAISLYLREGFSQVGQVEIEPDVFMTRFQRTIVSSKTACPEGDSPESVG